MILICHNQKHALFSSEDTTFLYQLPSFRQTGTLQAKAKIGALQYGTGIAAIVSQSKVRIYDFVLNKDVYDFESYLKILRVGLHKNLLIVASSERILIHDLKSKTNQCYIPIQEGSSVFMSYQYYNLSIAYYLESHMLASRSIWLNHVTRIEGVKFTFGVYSQNAKQIALSLKNVLSIYEQGELVKVYGFDFQILQMVSVGEYFFLKLGNGQILGCSKIKQVQFLQCQQINIDFWDHEYESVLLGDAQSVFQICKGIVKRYHVKHAQDCAISDSRTGKQLKQAYSMNENTKQ